MNWTFLTTFFTPYLKDLSVSAATVVVRLTRFARKCVCLSENEFFITFIFANVR